MARVRSEWSPSSRTSDAARNRRSHSSVWTCLDTVQPDRDTSASAVSRASPSLSSICQSRGGSEKRSGRSGGEAAQGRSRRRRQVRRAGVSRPDGTRVGSSRLSGCYPSKFGAPPPVVSSRISARLPSSARHSRGRMGFVSLARHTRSRVVAVSTSGRVEMPWRRSTV